MEALLKITLSLGLLFLLTPILCGQPAAEQGGQPAAEQGGPPAVEAGELALILQKLADGRQLSGDDIAKLDNAVIRVDDSQLKAGDTEIGPIEREKKVYILKVERGALDLKQLMEMQKALLRGQIMVMKVLGVMAKHQERLERRVARTENIQRELGLGMKDLGHGVDRARLDIASTNAETSDISEMSEDLSSGIKEMLKILEDLENLVN